MTKRDKEKVKYHQDIGLNMNTKITPKQLEALNQAMIQLEVKASKEYLNSYNYHVFYELVKELNHEVTS